MDARSPLSAAVAAHACLRVPIADVAPLRKSPGRPVHVSLLKNADEQTVVAVAALFRAVEHAGQPLTAYREWGVLGCPRFIGRDLIGQAVTEYRREGPPAISPHIIPHRSLHSTSGTLTLALDCHGPNYGVGGGPGHEAEGLLAAFAMLHERPVPGVWLAITRVDPVGRCDTSLGRPADGSAVEAVVVGLTRDGDGPRLTLDVGSGRAAFGFDDLARLLGA